MNNPLTYKEALSYRDIALTLTRGEAEVIEKALMKRALNDGVASEKVMPVIYSITKHFVEDEREMMKKCIEEDLRKHNYIRVQNINAEDEQIVEAIKITLPQFKSDWDWGGIYRILVDVCQFPSKKTDFVKRMAEIGIYAQDKTVAFVRSIAPTINKDEYCNHPFSYQNVQKGTSPQWPATYQEWLRKQDPDQDLRNRIAIATAFYNNLINVTEMI